MTASALLVARILLGLVFVVPGLGKMANVPGLVAYMETGGVPGMLAWPVIGLEVLGGLALIVGLQTRVAALGLAVFCVLAGFLYHFNPADQNEMTQLLKNLSIAGGMLALAISGPGRLSIDARRGAVA